MFNITCKRCHAVQSRITIFEHHQGKIRCPVCGRIMLASARTKILKD